MELNDKKLLYKRMKVKDNEADGKLETLVLT